MNRTSERLRIQKLAQAGLGPRLNGDPTKIVFGDGSVGDANGGQKIGGFTIGANSISGGTGNGALALEISG